MKRTAIVCVVALAMSSGIVVATNFGTIREFLTGYEEVPSVSTGASARFSARIKKEGPEIEWQLRYSELEGDVQQSHIHFAQKGVNGGITVFLCTNLGNGPAGTQACPPGPAVISGTIVAADVSPNIPATLAARNQGLNTGEIEELIDAMHAGATYVNVHSSLWPAGEIRSQINVGR
jgi:CHRD domain-containing protein